MCAQLWNEYLNPTPAGPGRVISAEMFVVGGQQVKANSSVLITSANSPAGLQAGERALGLDQDNSGLPPAREVLLISAATMHAGFPPIGRLDELARTASGPLNIRLTDLPGNVDIFPTKAGMWFGEYYRVSRIDILNEQHRSCFLHAGGELIDSVGIGNKLVVFFEKQENKAKNAIRRLVRGGAEVAEIDALRPAEEFKYGLFDQVVLSTGRARGGRGNLAEDEEGSALELVWDLRNELNPILMEGYNFPLGLKSEDGALRILGAAGINNPIYHAGLSARENLLKFEKTLPAQARVNNEGITLSAVTIALANGYFTCGNVDCNKNINTATFSELVFMLGQVLGSEIIDLRSTRVKPFQSTKEMWRALAVKRKHRTDVGMIQVLNDTDWLLSEKWNAHMLSGDISSSNSPRSYDVVLENVQQLMAYDTWIEGQEGVKKVMGTIG